MPRLLASFVLLIALPWAAMADVPATSALQPFVATYQVFHDGHELGEATMQLVHVDGARWRVDLVMRGNGLMRLTGLNLQQSTLFDTDGLAYRPLSQSTVKRAFLSRRKTVGLYDWNNHTAQWTGDVRSGHAGPVSLQQGDMSGLLIDLAVIRDARPGTSFHYRFVDDGRVRDHNWVVAPQTESVAVGDLSYDAMRANRVQDGGDDTLIWVASGVPTTIRILQREDGSDITDLRLTQYKGAAP
ncbi:MAG: secreted protein [Xanthomonadaceae bacterium]|nr:secreted protein [Xanthomonadaceae bacterium]